MKRTIKTIAAGLVVLTAFTAGMAADGLVSEIQAQLRQDMKVVVDGKTQQFTDVNGNAVYPILYNGTTYLPVRAIGNLMGKQVGWDGATMTVTLSDPNSSVPEKTEAGYKLGETLTYIDANIYVGNYLSAYTEIENTGNVDLYISDGAYDLEDENGSLIDTFTLPSVCPNVIKPGEKAVLSGTIEIEDTGKAYKVVPNVSVKPAKIACVRYEVSDLKLSQGAYTGIEVVGRINNQTTEDDSYVNVAVILRDKAGNVIGTMYTYVDELPVGQKKSFKATNFGVRDIDAEDVGSYEVYAYPIQYQF